MSDLNTYTATGRLGADPDTRYTASGTAIWSARIAVGYGYGDKAGTNWITVKSFGKRAESLAKLELVKGARLGFTGTLEVREYERKDGTKGTAVECVANDIALLGSKPEGQRQQSQPKPTQKSDNGSLYGGNPDSYGGGGFVDSDLDQIPF